MSFIFILEAIMQLSMFAMLGIYLIFSNTLMPVLRNREAGEATMVEINEVILNPVFLCLFMGSGISALYLVIVKQGTLALAGGVFFAGTTLVTMIRNVPLNNALRDNLTQQSDGVFWQTQYLPKWLFWNHLRTVCSFISGFLLLV